MDAKLIQARAEIEEILKKHDIAGYILLHNAPGNIEFSVKLLPSYSRLQETPDGDSGVYYSLKATASNNPEEAQKIRDDLQATANMLHGLASALSQTAPSLIRLSQHISQQLGFTHTLFLNAQGPVH